MKRSRADRFCCTGIICFIFLLMIQGLHAQQRVFPLKKPHPPDQKEMEIMEKNVLCARYSNLDFSTRLKRYPFSKACKIQFVSFENNMAGSDSVIFIGNEKLPILNDTVCYSKLTEVKTLTNAEIDSLSDIIYNIGYGGPVTISFSSGCYIPRNAILFLTCSGKVIEFIEICFECQGTRESSKKVSLGEMCDSKLDLVMSLFRKTGIVYGMGK